MDYEATHDVTHWMHTSHIITCSSAPAGCQRACAQHRRARAGRQRARARQRGAQPASPGCPQRPGAGARHSRCVASLPLPRLCNITTDSVVAAYRTCLVPRQGDQPRSPCCSCRQASLVRRLWRLCWCCLYGTEAMRARRRELWQGRRARQPGHHQPGQPLVHRQPGGCQCACLGIRPPAARARRSALRTCTAHVQAMLMASLAKCSVGETCTL